jgi:RNA polymerase sigma-70 factor (ECF subfamily)
MTPESMPIGELLASLRRGDHPAASELFRRYNRRLVGLARQRLDARTRQKVDPEDVVQSVFRSFFRRHDQGQFEVGDDSHLWSLLATIAARKCAHRIRYFRAALRAVQREAPPAGDAGDSTAEIDPAGFEPSAEEPLLLVETVERLMRGLQARDRTLVELCLQGLSVKEVAEQGGVSERKVQLLLQQIQRRLHTWLTEE